MSLRHYAVGTPHKAWFVFPQGCLSGICFEAQFSFVIIPVTNLENTLISEESNDLFVCIFGEFQVP